MQYIHDRVMSPQQCAVKNLPGRLRAVDRAGYFRMAPYPIRDHHDGEARDE
jgi:hypothetical protein